MKETLINDEYVLLEVELFHSIPLLHLVVKKWSHTILKNYFFPKWIEVQSILKKRGHKLVLAVVQSSNKKAAKFHAIMGMHEAINDGDYIISRRYL